MTHRDDEQLSGRFQELRADVRRSGAVPDFSAMMAESAREAAKRPPLEVVAGGAASGHRSSRRRRLVRAGVWASAAAAAAVTALILVDRGPSGDEDFERLVAAYASQAVGEAWSSPTSGLLDVPGIDLMRSMPSIGDPVRTLDPAALPAPQPSPQEDNA